MVFYSLLLAALIGVLMLDPDRGNAQGAEERQPARAATETLKERLSDKASDEQRVDNCKVPLDRRGSKERPDACEHEGNPTLVPLRR